MTQRSLCCALIALAWGCGLGTSAEPRWASPEPADPERCRATAGSAARAFYPRDPERLAGVYELVSVYASGGDSAVAWLTELRLAVSTDSLGYPRLTGTHLEQRQLEGTDSVITLRRGVTLERDILYLGPPLQLDWSAPQYRVLALVPGGFWGYWHHALWGNVELRGPDNRPIPDPAGWFCAQRR